MNHIGRHTYMDNDVILRSWLPTETITIGSFCSIASGTLILAGGRHHTSRASTFPFEQIMQRAPVIDRVYQTTRGTVIGSDVWIASRAIVLGGARIGHGAVISAGSVVHGNVPPYAIVAGNPAAIVCYRFSPETIARLLRIAWWDWEDATIEKNLDLFYGPIDEFLRRFDPVRAT